MLHCAKATQHFIALLSDDCEETVDCSVILYYSVVTTLHVLSVEGGITLDF